MPFVEVDGQQLEYLLIPARRRNRPTLVFLHEGLGSVSLWRDFPASVAEASGCRTMLWSRLGHGDSAPLAAARTPRYLHEEALHRLPPLLDALAIERPLLVGHSDGASIALIHAAAFPDRVAGLVVLAPHAFVEAKALAGIVHAGESYAGEASGERRRKLARHHRDADAVFAAWHDIWLAPEFRAWDIRDCLPAIRCPLLAVQGEDDEFATMRQIECIAEAVSDSVVDRRADVDLLKLADCRHSPHRDQPLAVRQAIVRFVDRLAAAGVGALPGGR